MENKKNLIVLVGPTAVGKTKMSIDIAKTFNCEIISGDSMQVYKEMNIGTAKIKLPEMQGIPHHLINIKEPDEDFTVAEFQKMVREKIDDITLRAKIPMIVGGTGLYIQAILYDYQFSHIQEDKAFRKKMEQKVANGQSEQLYSRLEEIDPISARKIHPNNIQRVIRALEIYELSGKSMSEWQQNQKEDMIYNTALIGLTMDRKKLYDRINQRVDLMIEEGLLEEVKSLYQSGIRNTQSIKAIGYKELYQYFDGQLTLEESIEHLKRNSRQFAKRQYTWFRNKMDVRWFDLTDEREHLKKTSQIIDFIAGKLQIKSNT